MPGGFFVPEMDCFVLGGFARTVACGSISCSVMTSFGASCPSCLAALDLRGAVCTLMVLSCPRPAPCPPPLGIPNTVPLSVPMDRIDRLLPCLCLAALSPFVATEFTELTTLCPFPPVLRCAGTLEAETCLSRGIPGLIPPPATGCPGVTLRAPCVCAPLYEGDLLGEPPCSRAVFLNVIVHATSSPAKTVG